jgi:hypothetical protein
MDESQKIDALQQAYCDDEKIRQILDVFAGYQNSVRTVNVDIILTKIGGSNIKQREIVARLKYLQELGFGSFRKGARQHRSRFEFPRSKGPRYIALFGQGSDEKDLPDDTSEDFMTEDGASDAGNDQKFITHKFQLRERAEVTFSLPRNLTMIEANRLCLWIRSLPFDGNDEA